MNIITKEQLETSIPYQRELSSNYLELYSLYNHLLMQYIIRFWGIKRYDEAFLESKNKFSPIKEEDMDIYQFRAKGYLSFLYLRNNIYIERLDSAEANYLERRLKEESEELTNEDITFLNKTISKVILEDYKDSTMTLYGPDNGNFLRPRNAIIIGMRHDDFAESENPEWEGMHNKRATETYFFTRALVKELKEKLPVPVEIIEYNDFSIKRNSDFTRQGRV